MLTFPVKPELALLVDGDQVGAQRVAKRLADLEKSWDVTARVCIRNWRSSTEQADWDAVARDCRMECIQHAPETRAKNATDIELAVRAMDLLHGSGYRAFCILSGDSDFRPLARRLERGGAHVLLEDLNPAPPSAKVANKPLVSASSKAAKARVPAPPKVAAHREAPKPSAARAKEPDAAGFSKIVGHALDQCIKFGHADGKVPLATLASRIPAASRKESFGYPKSRSMRIVVESLTDFDVMQTSPGQYAVRRK